MCVARARRPCARRPGTAGRMDDEQRFLLDLNGYLHLKNVLSPRELAACRAAADRHISICEAVADGRVAAGTVCQTVRCHPLGPFQWTVLTHFAHSTTYAVPEGFGNGAKPGQPGGKGYSNGFAWEKPLEQLLFHRKLWPIVRCRPRQRCTAASLPSGRSPSVMT